jgi:hypothetical protein
MPVIQTDPASSFTCDYVAGINRVLSLPPYLLVDNIGRNFEMWQFRPAEREPLARARYNLTSFPGNPIASLLDVDIHAAFVRNEGRELLAVNHFGRVRRFDLPPAGQCMQPVWEGQLLGDTERVVMAGDCFIASSPRGEHTDDPAQPGVFLFEPIDPSPGPARRLGCDQVLADWGVTTALAVSTAGDRLAVAAGQRLGVFGLRGSGVRGFEVRGSRVRSSEVQGLRLADCVWEVALSCHCQWLHFDATGHLWAGGHRPSEAGADEDACWGGGIERFTVDAGVRRAIAALPEATAWGYGADPIVLTRDGQRLYVVCRDASLHAIDAASGASRELCSEFADLDDAATPSLGIGHAALHDGRLYAGFSRGGFRLLRYDLDQPGS